VTDVLCRATNSSQSLLRSKKNHRRKETRPDFPVHLDIHIAEGLVTNGSEDKHIDVQKTLARGRRPVEVITKRLESAFRISKDALKGEVRRLDVRPELAVEIENRLEALRASVGDTLNIEWSPSRIAGQLLGTMKLYSRRIQPFTLFIDSLGNRLLLRCVSPVGVVDFDDMREAIASSVTSNRVRLGAVKDRDEGSYNLTVQEDVLLAGPQYDAARADALLGRVAEEADRLELTHLPGQGVCRQNSVRE
jgi:hypothetical protein